jgi:hypothetical protein
MSLPRRNRRVLWLGLLLGGLGCAVLAAGLSVAALIGLSRDGDGFDAARWRQAREEGCTPDNPRLGMYPELRSVLLRQRPAEAGVLTMLGQPDIRRRPGAVSYMLGMNVIDCDVVEIRFGPDGRVSEVRYVPG